MQARHYVISGKVQGVYYRRSTQLQAQQLNVRGWVKNLTDGRVEAYALGTLTQLQAFETFLQQGPPGARVSAVSVEEAAISHTEAFEIRE